MTTTTRAHHSFDRRWNEIDRQGAIAGARITKMREAALQAHGNGGHDVDFDDRCPACEDDRRARVKRLVAMRERIGTAILRNPGLLAALRGLP